MNKVYQHIIKVIIASLFVLTATGISTDARKITTRLKAPVSTKTAIAEKGKRTASHKGFKKVSDALTFMAYDKRGSADKETFFIDNGSDVDLRTIEIEITYYNEAGRQIDRRTVDITGEFPAKETRKVDIPSWDKQKSFHYINSLPSKSSIPYTVRFKVISFIPLQN